MTVISYLALHYFHSSGLKNGLQAYLSWYTGKTSWRADLISTRGGNENSAGGSGELSSSSATGKLARALLCSWITVAAAISHSFHPASQLFVPDVAVGILLPPLFYKRWRCYSLSPGIMKPFCWNPCCSSQVYPSAPRTGLAEPAAG